MGDIKYGILNFIVNFRKSCKALPCQYCPPVRYIQIPQLSSYQVYSYRHLKNKIFTKKIYKNKQVLKAIFHL